MKKLIPVLLVVIFFSCSKKSDPAPTTSDLLSQHTWVFAAMTSTDATFQAAGQILIGSEWSFKTDKSLVISISISGSTATITGTWSLSVDGKTITINSSVTGTTAASEMEIISITSSALQVKETSSGAVNTYTFNAK